MSIAAAVGGAAGHQAPPPAPPSRGKLTPYFLLLPAGLALLIFYVLPTLTLATTSLQEGSLEKGYELTWHFPTYGDVLSQYWPQFLRSFGYAAGATVLALLIAYPLAYTIAFKAGQYRSLLLMLVIAPLFTSFLIRTLAWRQILADEGPIVGFLKSTGIIHITDAIGLTQGRILATGTAVVIGLAYNFLPFMTLPLYNSLEKIDRGLLGASGDLYANSWTTFWKVTWPLSLPGVVGGTLLTFIPAAGDYVNQRFLGTISNTMAGNAIDSLFLQQRQYPQAAALSLVLMVAIIALVTMYVKRAGTEDLL